MPDPSSPSFNLHRCYQAPPETVSFSVQHQSEKHTQLESAKARGNINIVKQKWLKIQGKWPWSPGPHSNKFMNSFIRCAYKIFHLFSNCYVIGNRRKDNFLQSKNSEIFAFLFKIFRPFQSLNCFPAPGKTDDYRTTATPGCTTDFVQLLIYY